MRVREYYQIALDVAGKPCLVVGGGEEAVEKTRRLLDAGARVTVVAPQAAPDLQCWAREGRLTLLPRCFEEGDVEGVFLVQVCVKDNRDLSRTLFALAQEKRFLVNAWDQPEFSNFAMPALVRCGRLRIAISTGGASPMLAGALRRELEQLFDDDFAAYLEWLAERRRAAANNPDERGGQGAAQREGIRGLRVTGRVEYPEAYLRQRKR
ncbi:MAG: bifunctional precorrin-2 dehydrogenase/sirohydrochlorin ferrochelatase [Armatimonadota bacterium]|nr:bifunctional precorrin-2 dehydrogenase/sirohydrochlorin ferrochelatase [Armatimonadota bacterium]